MNTPVIDDAFWASLERAAARVATWPAWKTGTVSQRPTPATPKPIDIAVHHTFRHNRPGLNERD
ncbi:MAG TPA: hypothetical protein VN579_07490 [Bryobacteraceae bacterium]|nr:hypothetical protein [Bryobacteraceae bacterium]